MTMLIERYLAAALEGVPDSQRDDTAREIRAAIGEMIELRMVEGESQGDATEHALNELGDPRRLAASYSGEPPRYLIGPGWYPAYISAITRIPMVVLPFVALISLVVAIGVDNERLGSAIGGAVESVLWAAAAIVFWVTVGFAIAERTVGPEMSSKREGAWTVDDLPEAPAERQITLGGTLPAVIGLVFLAALALVQFAEGIGFFVRRGAESIENQMFINPDLAIGWEIGFFALIVFSIVVEVVRYLRGFWTRQMYRLELVSSAIWIVYIVALAMSAPMVNPDLARRMDEGGDWWEAGGSANWTIAAIIIVISLQSTWEAWRGHREYLRQYRGVEVALAEDSRWTV